MRQSRAKTLVIVTSAVLGLVFLSGRALSATSTRTAMPDMSFFEYLGVMVEDDDGWVDPLHMEEPDFEGPIVAPEGARTEQVVERNDVQIDEQTDEQTDEQIDEQIDKITDGSLRPTDERVQDSQELEE